MEVFTDREKILDILTNPEIWDLVRNGADVDPSSFILPRDWLYLTETGNEVFVLSNSHQIHVNVLPETRHRAYWMSKKFIRWIKDNTELSCIFLKIHERHSNAIGLGKMCGFKEINYSNSRYLFEKRLVR